MLQLEVFSPLVRTSYSYPVAHRAPEWLMVVHRVAEIAEGYEDISAQPILPIVSPDQWITFVDGIIVNRVVYIRKTSKVTFDQICSQLDKIREYPHPISPPSYRVLFRTI